MSKPPAKFPTTADGDPKISRWRLEELLGPAREAIIEHEGNDYRLRLTSNGKLILTK